MENQHLQPQRERHRRRDYLAGVGWGSIPLILFLSAYIGVALSLTVASWLLVLTLVAYIMEVIAFYLIRKGGAFILGLVTMLLLTLLLASFLLYEPLLSGRL